MTSWRLAIALLMSMCLAHLAYALECYICDSNGATPCNRQTTANCTSNQVCQTEVRDENNLYSVRKECKQDVACVQSPSDCGSGSGNSVCTHCCTTSFCNSDYSIDLPSTVAVTTPQPGQTTTGWHADTTAPSQPATHQPTTEQSSAVSTDCNHAWHQRSSAFVIAALNRTVVAAYSMASFQTTGTVSCAMRCSHSDHCEFFAFNPIRRQCVIGEGAYAESKLQSTEQMNVFKTL